VRSAADPGASVVFAVSARHLLWQSPRFPNKSYKGGWIANVVIAAVYTLTWIIVAVAVLTVAYTVRF
jgi:hypothetical protein